MFDYEKPHETQPVDQMTLRDIIIICKAKTDEILNDNIAYLRTPTSTILVHDNRNYKAITKEGLIGDFEVWRLDWLYEEHIGYGPHTLTTYKFFTGGDKIRAKRIVEYNDTNGDPREYAIEHEGPYLPDYLKDDDHEFALIKQSFEGLPLGSRLSGSTEQQMEAIKRLVGGDPEEAKLGLQDLDQDEAEGLRRLLLMAEPTRDPYFEM